MNRWKERLIIRALRYLGYLLPDMITRGLVIDRYAFRFMKRHFTKSALGTGLGKVGFCREGWVEGFIYVGRWRW